MTDSQHLEIGRIFVNGEACIRCPYLRTVYMNPENWISCDVLNGTAHYEECQGIKGEDEECLSE